MAKTMLKSDLEGADKPSVAEDVMPEVEDDVEVSARQPLETEEIDEAPRRKPQRQDEETADDDPRARATRRYREIRDREEAAARAAKEAEKQPPEDVDPVEDDAAEGEDVSDDQQSEQAPQQKPRTFTLKVNGETEEVSEDVVISLAQIAKASDNLLDVAKSRATEAARLLKEAQEAQQRLRDGQENPPANKAANQPDQSRAQPDPEHPPVTGLDRERLRQITERIQVGDADEGTQALIDLVEDITAKVTPKVDANEIERVVQRTNAQTRTQAELDAALEGFVSKYPDVANDEMLADVGKTIIRKEIISDLKQAGVDEDTIASVARDEKLLVQAHKELRAANKGVRSYAALFETAGKTLTDRFGIKATSPQPAIKTAPQRAPSDQDRIQDRIDRKRAAPQQPRAAGVRQQVAPPPQRQTTRDIVRSMRKGRGFTLTE